MTVTLLSKRHAIPAVKHSRAPYNHGEKRYGVAAVEFAIIASLIVFLVIGMIEISRGIMVSEVLSNAARSGCRMGCQSTASNSEIEAEVNAILKENNLDGNACTVTIRVNDKVKDVTTAAHRDKVSVTVAIPVSSVYWTSTIFLADSYQLSETMVMMRQ